MSSRKPSWNWVSTPLRSANGVSVPRIELPVMRTCHATGMPSASSLAVLGRHPDFDLVADDVSGAVLWLHGGVAEERHFVPGLDALDGLGEAFGDIAVAPPDAGVGCVEAG